MKTMKLTLFSIPVLALLLSVVAVNEAEAKIRVQATLKTPYGRVIVDNGAYRPARGYRQVLPVRHYADYRVSQKDRKVARRLGRYTGVPKRELIQMKRMGYTWRQIGNWLGISPKVVRAAKSQKKWERFLDRHRHRRYSEVGGYYRH